MFLSVWPYDCSFICEGVDIFVQVFKVDATSYNKDDFFIVICDDDLVCAFGCASLDTTYRFMSTESDSWTRLQLISFLFV